MDPFTSSVAGCPITNHYQLNDLNAAVGPFASVSTCGSQICYTLDSSLDITKATYKFRVKADA